MGRLDGKVAVVTGGGRGIGRAIAEVYLREGARVTATVAREHGEIESLAAEVVARPAVYLASDGSRRLTGRRIVATEWSPEAPDGRPASEGLGT